MNIKIVVVLILSASTSSCSVAEKAKTKLTYKQAELLSVPQDANRAKATFFDEGNTVYSEIRCMAGGDCIPPLKNINTTGYMDIYHDKRVGQLEPDTPSTALTSDTSERATPQTPIVPSDDLNLVLLPHENNYPVVNSPQTPEPPTDSVTEPVEQEIPSTNPSIDDSGRSGTTTSQSAIYPNNDLDLIQLPDESNYQAVNSLRTSELPNNSEIDQKAEYRNVIFNQLDSPNALHTINSVRHDAPRKAGDLKQNFKFKNVEMIQRNVGGGIHSMNYMGD